MSEETQLPEPCRRQLRRAARILREAGCTEVFLLGSLATGEIKDKSDSDLAVRGCPKGEFFHTPGRLLLELDSSALELEYIKQALHCAAWVTGGAIY